MQIHYSNRLEILADELGHRLGEAPASHVLSPELISVPHAGMARWLSLALARRLGVSANLRYPLPAALIWQLLRAVMPELAPRSRFEPGVLKWAVLGQLDAAHRSFGARGALAHYLSNADALMRYELADRIAGCFDRYLVYRPEWILGWEGGVPGARSCDEDGESQWQRALWSGLVRELGSEHWAAVARSFLGRVERAGAGETGALPRRAFIFGVTALSPSYLELLRALSGLVELELFVLNPCREYWGDILAPRAVLERAGAAEPETLYLTEGNPLLASFGRVGRELIDALQDAGGLERERFVPAPPGAGLLGQIQNDILDLRDGTQAESGGRPVPRSDRSVQVHACHGAVREMEVLHDQLLAMFDADPSLDPGRIVVLTPDIRALAPAVEAVFGAAAPEHRIPYAISDRRPADSSPLIDTFFRLLEVASSRFPADQVSSLLDHPALARRFRIDPAWLPRLRSWIAQAGIHWGIDSASMAREGLPANQSHTWRSGLDRLLIGVAMQSAGWRLFDDLLAFEDIDAADAEALGALVGLLEALSALAIDVQRERTVPEWVECLDGVLAGFFAPRGREENEVQLLRTTLRTAAADTLLAGFDAPVPVAVARAHLLSELPALEIARSLDDPDRASLMFTGRVTFCELVPTRSVPFDIVCLVGMNDGSYPRPEPRLGFDLMARSPRRGDRTRRDDDRYLFLESILAARRCLYLSYAGFDGKDNAEVPPCTLVSELLDYIEASFEVEGDRVQCHPLQAFSPRYFDQRGPSFSYHRGFCEAARVLIGTPEPAASLVTRALPTAETISVPPADFVRFFEHPARYFLHQRLGVRLQRPADAIVATEPFALEGLDGYRIRHKLLELELSGHGDRAEAILDGSGALPAGEVGRLALRREHRRLRRFIARLSEDGAVPSAEVLALDLDLGPVRIEGEYRISRPAGWRAAKLRPRDQLAAWVRHLLTNAALGSTRTRWIYLDQELVFAPVDEPAVQLQVLAGAFKSGLAAPLPLFPRSSFAYVEAPEQRRIAAARKAWSGASTGNAPPPESLDADLAWVYGSSDPLDPAFAEVALQVAAPVVAARQLIAWPSG